MATLQNLENSLDEIFEKKAPKMPVNARKGLAGALWWLALIFGILQLLAAWGLWRLGHVADRYVDLSNSLSVAYGTGETISPNLGLFFNLSLVVLVLDVVLMLMAVSGLKAFKKSGWNLLFYSLIVNAVYGVVRAFSEVGGGFGQAIWSLIGSAVGAYLLFQVRSYFLGRNPASGKSA